MSHLKIEFGFGIEKDREGLSIDRDRQHGGLKMIRRAAARLFSAYTLVPTFGGWTNGDGRLVEEDGYTLFVIRPHIPHPDEEGRPTLIEAMDELVREIKLALDQEAVAVTITPVQFELK